MVEDVKLKKGMCRDEVNRLLKENNVDLELVDEVYGGNNFNHKWKCECGNIMEKRMWASVKGKGALICDKCKYQKIENRYREEVEKDEEYEYIRSFRSGEKLPNGKIVDNKSPYIQIKHLYCGSTYEIKPNNFINLKQRCNKCCGSYENSFASYVENELNLKIKDIWDFKNNTVSPFCIGRGSHQNIFINCTNPETPYHGSYLIAINNFIRAKQRNKKGCPYCHSKKTHPKDSFAQYHIDNTDKNFLEIYWDYKKNSDDPFNISVYARKKVWIKCIKTDYHGSYEILCSDFTDAIKKNNSGCPFCANRPGKIHLYDSFGYNNFNLVLSWSLNNKISPFKVAKSSGKNYKFICPECGVEFKRRIAQISSQKNVLCSNCSMSKGEKKISEILMKNNINFIYEKQFKNLIGLKGGNLSYDFYLPKYKLLIEYQGEFHDGTSNMPNEEQYKKQQEHDRRKREYAKNNGYKLLEIWYWDFDNIEEILDKEIGSLL
ncbi:TPA: hypothetical protein OLX52_002329 [Clostridioides difficile]|nr:hypothetical protein [Clostridioides difficile]HCQ5442818.1 hypothetical protein [Clostridioides difficile]